MQPESCGIVVARVGGAILPGAERTGTARHQLIRSACMTSGQFLEIPSGISREVARTALLFAQGIEAPFRPNVSREGVRQSIAMMGQLQIDTINVVARSPYLVLWSRLGSFDSVWLDELHADGAIYEAWSHEACFLPIEDYRFTRARTTQPRSFRRWYFEFANEHREQADQMLEHIRTNGAVRSSDFEHPPGTRGVWWDRKVEKHLLEALFTEGSLMIARRERFQRIYDLRERVHPAWDAEPLPTIDEMVRAYVVRSVKAMGVATAAWIPDYYRLKVGEVVPVLQQLVAEGHLLTTSIDGIPGHAFVHPENVDLLHLAMVKSPARTTLLSPFDPVVWDRRRGLELFDFFYRIECYTPAEKRQFGYFSLPILHKGALVGRLDAKAHRKDRVLEVRELHLEPSTDVTDDLVAGVGGAIRSFADWHQTPAVRIRKSKPRGFAPMLRRALKQIDSE